MVKSLLAIIFYDNYELKIHNGDGSKHTLL